MWVARNKNGTLWLYRQKPYRLIEDDNGPYREQTLWETDDDVDFECALDPKLFPDLKWEDEPIEVCLCLNSEKFHTVKVEELDRLYRMDWNYSDMKQTLDTFEDRIQRYNSLPWYKRIFKKV